MNDVEIHALADRVAEARLNSGQMEHLVMGLGGKTARDPHGLAVGDRVVYQVSRPGVVDFVPDDDPSTVAVLDDGHRRTKPTAVHLIRRELS